MRNINIDEGWGFDFKLKNGFDGKNNGHDKLVNLPHDYMIATEVTADAPAGPASGYYTAGVGYYTKKIVIPKEWEGERVSLRFDGVMMNAAVDLNGCKMGLQHYGYAPFEVDLTSAIYWGKENTIRITVNPSMQPNSRWYSGAGIFRSVELVHTPMVYIENDGIFGYTKSIEYANDGTAEVAFLQTEVSVCNQTNKNQIVMVEVGLKTLDSDDVIISRTRKVQINPNSKATAFIPVTLENPVLWSLEDPNLYSLYAKVKTLGTYGAHFMADDEFIEDECATLFGIRTVTADVVHGLRINGMTVKLKGGCLHHDNGVLGAVSLYDSEARRIKMLKEMGFNAIRTTHNPPSAAFMEACDRLGMYVFDEAFDCWGIGKQPGDYSMFFDTDWEKDLTAFIKRDRNHPSVVIWSTGNEITERAGLNNGYTLATKLADCVHRLDQSRPVSNGICSMWSGFDDETNAEQSAAFFAMVNGEVDSVQNADFGADDNTWEEATEAFTNGLDIVGYNYMEDKYEKDHEMYPERVILGSENYPKEIGKRWPMVESTPYVLGDFTWTAWDYIGEAGIGKSVFMEDGDPRLKAGPFALMSHGSQYPWRLANDADFDINGNLLPQGAYRNIVWGSDRTYVMSYDPASFSLIEVISMWGFTGAVKNWNWDVDDGTPVKLLVFSRAEEVELFINGKSLGKKKQNEALTTEDLPLSFVFEGYFEPGEVLAISYNDGKEVSRDVLSTTGEAAKIRLCPETTELKSDGHSLAYIPVEIVDADGNVVPVGEYELTAEVSGAGELLGFGSGSPVTEDNYASGKASSYRGKAMAVVRSGYEKGEATLKVKSEKLGECEITINVG